MKKSLCLIVIFVLLLSCNENSILQKNIVGYWSFDNCTAEDYSLNVLDGIIEGNLKCVEGFKGKAFLFNEKSGITVKNIPMLRNFTLNFCFKLKSNNTGQRIFLSFEPPDDEIKIFLDKDASIKLEEKDSDNHVNIVSNLETNKFYCLTFVNNFDERKQTFYLNGKLIKTNDNAQLFNISQLKIGYENNLEKSFKGILDEIIIFDKALSKSEVKKLYEFFKGDKN